MGLVEGVVLGVGCFLLGVLVGASFREAGVVARTGHTRLTGAAKWVRSHLSGVGVLLVVIALGANAASGFLTISNGRADADRTRCNRHYNELDGLARDERASVSRGQTEAGIVLWAALRQGIKTQKLTAEQLDKQIGAYIASLKATLNAQAKNPYPDPDMCGGE